MRKKPDVNKSTAESERVGQRETRERERERKS